MFKGLFKDNKRTVTALENVVLYNKTYVVNFTYAEKDTILTIFPINLFKMFMKLFFFFLIFRQTPNFTCHVGQKLKNFHENV